ncbi:hypothetical protein GGD61_007600 [Bradyrhizobium sp. SBR1B]|nr:hypothetical protein [Bradyrhizobium sp. SBR1B]
MQVIGQDHDRVDLEWSFGPCDAECAAQLVDMIDQRGRCSIVQRHGEEEGAAGKKIAPIANHADRPGLRFASSGLQPDREICNQFARLNAPAALATLLKKRE